MYMAGAKILLTARLNTSVFTNMKSIKSIDMFVNYEIFFAGKQESRTMHFPQI